MHLDEEVREVIVEPLKEPLFVPEPEQAPAEQPQTVESPAVPAVPQEQPALVRSYASRMDMVALLMDRGQ
jgi:hypothetical protein